MQRCNIIELKCASGAGMLHKRILCLHSLFALIFIMGLSYNNNKVVYLALLVGRAFVYYNIYPISDSFDFKAIIYGRIRLKHEQKKA